MKSQERKCETAEETVLVISPPLDDSNWIWRRQHAGIRRFARALNWQVRFELLSSDVGTEKLKRIVRESQPIGIVSRLPVALPQRVTGGVPVVYFDCGMKGTSRCVVRHDATATAHLAATELFSLACNDFAFAAFPGDCRWCAARERAFRREIRIRHGRFRGVFVPSALDEPQIRRELAPWVERLPRPCCVFAANDLVAENLIAVCAERGLDVPDDVAVVGVDDDPERCLRAKPTITSVVPDWESGAFLAMETLARRMRGNVRTAGNEFRPLGIIRRGSTACRPSSERSSVTRAIEFIREHATEGISSADVVATMPCSRRLAELRFREVTGSSILEEISRVRLEYARAMLRRENCYLETVARTSGWKSVATFCHDFRRATGLTPTAWRRAAS